MGLGQANDVDGLDSGGAEDVGQGAPVLVNALETGVGGGVLALLHGGVGLQGAQGGVELGLGGVGHAVNGPGVDEVGFVGEVLTGVDVPVLGGDHQVVVPPVGGQVGGDALGDGVAAGHRQGASFAEGGLDVDDDEGPPSGGLGTGAVLGVHDTTIAGSAPTGARSAQSAVSRSARDAR